MSTDKFLFILITFFLGMGCIILYSCESEKESIIGKWEIISMHSLRGNELKEKDSFNFYEFNNDGTYMNRFEGENYDGNWTMDIENKKIDLDQGTMTFSGIYKLDQNTLTLDLNAYIFEKKDTVLGTTKIELEKIED